MAPEYSGHPSQQFDYVIVGGGTAGLTLASRLRKILDQASDPSSIIVIEAGSDPKSETAHEDYKHSYNYSGLNQVRTSPVTNWQFASDEGKGLNHRTADAAAGKGIGGSSLINAGIWLQAPRNDWDLWAKTVKDEQWSYDKMLQYFRLSENVMRASLKDDHEQQVGCDEHGYLKVRPVNSTGKKFPLRDKVFDMWNEAGMAYNPDRTSGDHNQVCESADIWEEGGKRQLPGDFLSLKGIKMWTESTVIKVILERSNGSLVARGVELADGRKVAARKEVILSAGAYQTPKLLQLSGIGDKDLLSQHDIRTVVENSEVGLNLADHLILTLTWQLKDPSQGLAFGSSKCTEAFWLEGLPLDFVQFHHLPLEEDLESALHLDGNTEHRDILRPDSLHIQNWIVYIPLPGELTGTYVPVDGRHISTFTCLVKPTSRGRVAIQSKEPLEKPLIEKNFQGTSADRLMMREGVRRMAKVISATKAGQSFVEREVTPDGHAAISPETTDGEVDARVSDFAWSISHPMGTCAMGKVVDSHCKVFGVSALRVVDASVIPITPAATIQATVYAVSERVAHLIGVERKRP